MFLSLLASDGGGDLPEDHLGRVADCRAQDSHRFRGVEVIDAGEVVTDIVIGGVVAAPGQEHKGHTVLQQIPEPHLGIQLIEFLQKAPSLHAIELFQIVRQVVRGHGLRGSN